MGRSEDLERRLVVLERHQRETEQRLRAWQGKVEARLDAAERERARAFDQRLDAWCLDLGVPAKAPPTDVIYYNKEFADDQAMLAWIRTDAAMSRSNSTRPYEAVEQAVADDAIVDVCVYEAYDIFAAMKKEMESGPHRLPTVFESQSMPGRFIMVSYDY